MLGWEAGIRNDGTHYLRDKIMGKRKKTRNIEYNILVIDGFAWLPVLLDILNGMEMEVIKEEIEELWGWHIRRIISMNIINTRKDDGRELKRSEIKPC